MSAKLPPEFQETLSALGKWLNRHLETLDPQTLEDINAQMISDILGKPSAPPTSLPSQDANRGRLGYAIVGLQSAFLRFQQVRVAASYYPWRGRIQRHDHLEMMAHLFLAEVYIYRERLTEYLDACRKCERSWGTGTGADKLKEEVLKVYRLHFKRFINARNAHTHEADFRYPEISRLSLINLLAMSDKRFGIPAPHAFAAARKKLVKDIDDVIAGSVEIARAVLRRTQPIWSQL